MIQIWKMTYSDSRRKHTHRCRVCNKLLVNGDVCFMGLIGKKHKAIHQDCAALFVCNGDINQLELLGLHSLDAWKLKIGDEESLKRVRMFILKNNLLNN